MNLLGYVKTNQCSFKEMDINDVDILVFSWLSYIDFLPIKKCFPIKLEDLKGFKYFQLDRTYEAAFLVKKTKKFMSYIMNSERFKNIEIIDFISVLDRSIDTQYASLCLKVEGKLIITFRGTDPKFLGWKEDFYLCFKNTIFSYDLAKEFVLKIIEEHEEPIILAGHSKGGNIANYLLATLEDDNRIERVYSFDGPGFKEANVFKNNVARISKFKKIIPQSSLVGVLLTNETDVQIIKSKNIIVFQHNPYEWVIKNNNFIYLNKRTISSRYLDKCINGWIESLNEQEKERFTKILFDALDSFEIQDFSIFFKKIFKQIRPTIKAYKSLSKEDKKFFWYVIRRLAKHLAMPNLDVKSKLK